MHVNKHSASFEKMYILRSMEMPIMTLRLCNLRRSTNYYWKMKKFYNSMYEIVTEIFLKEKKFQIVKSIWKNLLQKSYPRQERQTERIWKSYWRK